MALQPLGILLDVGADGSIILPPDRLADAGITAGGKAELFSSKGVIFIRGIIQQCDICGASGAADTYLVGGGTEKQICVSCAETLGINRNTAVRIGREVEEGV